ncbi:hypothetical protein EMCRGX_G032519 [Ephydatia muelleri]
MQALYRSVCGSWTERVQQWFHQGNVASALAVAHTNARTWRPYTSSSTSTASSGTEQEMVPERLYTKINIKVKGSDYAVLDSYCRYLITAAKILGIDISGRVALPTRVQKYTVLKSPHIYKKHRVQYEVRTHSRLMQVKQITGTTADVFLEYTQRNLPEGVTMSVYQEELEALPALLVSRPEGEESGEEKTSRGGMNEKNLTKHRYICDKCLSQLKFNLLQSRLTRWEAQCKVLDVRRKVKLLREAVTDSAKLEQNSEDALRELRTSNTRRELRLKKVRDKNLLDKQDLVREECRRQLVVMVERREELCMLRKNLIQQLYEKVFTIEVEPLSHEDTGEDYKYLSQIDCNSIIEVDGDWLLSGARKAPAPNIRIVTASLPSNGDYTAYIIAARQYRHRKLKQGDKDDSHCMREPLPYPMVPTALHNSSNLMSSFIYGNPDRKTAEFKMTLAKLDDNIMYLCFSQCVPLSALTPGHTLENLLALVTHSELGRSGPFECYPEYVRFGGSTLDDDIPSVSYVRDSAMLQEDEGSEDGGGDEEQLNVDEIEWERVEPPSLMDMVSSRDPLSPQRTEIPDSYRERMMHLDYNSTYRDYAALGASERCTSLAPSTSDTSMHHPTEGSRVHGSLIGKLTTFWGSFSKPK